MHEIRDDWLPRLELGSEGGEFHFTVSPPSGSSKVQMHLNLTERDAGSSSLKCGEAFWRISWNKHELNNPILSLLPELVDACIAATFEGNDCVMLLVKGIDDRRVSLTTFVGSTPTEGRVHIRTLNIPPSIATDFALTNSADRDSIVRSYKEFVTWLADDTHALGGVRLQPNSLLLVKVDPSQLWFLKYPLSLFVRFGLGTFASYQSVQWIVTGRTFTENAINRKALAKELRSTGALLAGTVVVVNEYRRHLRGEVGQRIGDTVAVLVELLTQFENVNFEDKRYSLKWALNPTSKLLDDLFTRPSTRLFFSAFEAGSGKWQISEKIVSCHQTMSDVEEFYDLTKFRGRLGHIQLLRIFHCNSIFDPYVAASEDSNPADTNTIARQLLETDAQFVEGGMTEESYFDFACGVISLFFGTGLRMVLESRAAEGKLRLNSLINKCNRILAVQGLEPVSS